MSGIQCLRCFTTVFALLNYALGNGVAIGLPMQDSEFVDSQRVVSMSDQDESEVLNRLSVPRPDIRLVLSGVLRWQDVTTRYSDFRIPPSLITAQARHSGPNPNGDEKFPVFPPGFIGTRGKKSQPDPEPQERRELPIYANGFPAGRG